MASAESMPRHFVRVSHLLGASELRSAAAIWSYQGPDTSDMMVVTWSGILGVGSEEP